MKFLERVYYLLASVLFVCHNRFGKSLISFVLIFLCVTLSACNQKESYHTFDADKYLQTEGHISDEGIDIRSGLFIFPKSIETLKDIEYEYYCERGIGDNSYMIFLKGTYPDKGAYEEELKRLADINCTIETTAGDIKNNIEYTDTLFSYPAYVAIYHTNMSFEYALIDDKNNTVVYVFLKLCEGSDFLQDKYLPVEFKKKTMLKYDTNWKNQNIYYAPDGDGVYKYYLD